MVAAARSSMHGKIGEPESLTVVKVGGSLLAGEGDLQRVAAALAERRRDGGPLLVVASALKGVTDLLELAAIQALDRQTANGHLGHTLDLLRRRHLDVLRDLAQGGGGSRGAHGSHGAHGPHGAHGSEGSPASRGSNDSHGSDGSRGSDGSDGSHGAETAAARERVARALDEVEKLLGAIRASGRLPEAAYARLLSSGERLSVILLAAAIQAAGQQAQPMTAEEAGLRAAGPPRAGCCDVPASAAGLRRLRRRLRDRILVLTGFYGIGGDDGVVLFGRGGSDDTACAVAAGLDAGRLELWKDVPGLMSADPQEVRGARVIQEVSFDEVAQLGAYGSRIVHHGCLQPLRGRSTQVLISAVAGAGAASGTRLVERLRRGAARVVALAAMRSSPALIGAVGDGVAEDPAIRSRMLSCLAAAGVRSDLVALPSGRSGLSCTVHPDDLAPALSGLHESFFTSAPESRP